MSTHIFLLWQLQQGCFELEIKVVSSDWGRVFKTSWAGWFQQLVAGRYFNFRREEFAFGYNKKSTKILAGYTIGIFVSCSKELPYSKLFCFKRILFVFNRLRQKPPLKSTTTEASLM